MNDSISDSQIDEAWNKLLPELDQVLPEKKRKRFLLLPLLSVASFILLIGIIFSNKKWSNNNINNSQIASDLPLTKKEQVEEIFKSNINKTEDLLSCENLNKIDDKSAEHISAKLKKVVSRNDFEHDKIRVLENDIKPIISIANVEDDLFYFKKQNLKGLKIKFYDEPISVIEVSKLKFKKEVKPQLIKNINLGLGVLTATNSNTFNRQFKQNALNQIGFKGFVIYQLNQLLHIKYSLNYLPLSVNYQFENYINSSLYFNKTTIYNLNTLNQDLSLCVKMSKRWSLSTGFYFANNFNKIKVQQQTIYKVENSEKIISEEYKKINNEFGILKDDIGFVAGTEYRFKHFSIGFQKNVGLVNVIRKDQYFKRNQNNVFSLNLYLR